MQGQLVVHVEAIQKKKNKDRHRKRKTTHLLTQQKCQSLHEETVLVAAVLKGSPKIGTGGNNLQEALHQVHQQCLHGGVILRGDVVRRQGGDLCQTVDGGRSEMRCERKMKMN